MGGSGREFAGLRADNIVFGAGDNRANHVAGLRPAGGGTACGYLRGQPLPHHTHLQHCRPAGEETHRTRRAARGRGCGGRLLRLLAVLTKGNPSIFLEHNNFTCGKIPYFYQINPTT